MEGENENDLSFEDSQEDEFEVEDVVQRDDSDNEDGDDWEDCDSDDDTYKARKARAVKALTAKAEAMDAE